MDQILHKLSSANQQEIIKDIISLYQRQWHAMVNFLYFANAMTYRLFETNWESKEQRAQWNAEESLINPKSAAYTQALLASDFLLPDGIALQLWSKWTAGKKLYNLNGTDLTPLVLRELDVHWGASLYIYSLYDPKIGKGEEWLHKAIMKISQEYPHISIVFHHQSLYSDRGAGFPFEEVKKISEADSAEVKLFLNCLWSPFQEIWTQEYKEFFQECGFLLMNVGGFIDFVAGFEKRAPRWVVKARVLETFWRIAQNPRKNLKKFLAMFGILRILSGKLRLKKKRG